MRRRRRYVTDEEWAEIEVLWRARFARERRDRLAAWAAKKLLTGGR